MNEIKTKSAEETVELGKKIGAFLLPNDVIALTGQLGAGKTTLIQGIAAGLGVKDYVTSPTFIIINEYDGHLPLYHIDLYRIADEKAAIDIGVEDYLPSDGVTVIEWPERIESLLPPGTRRWKIEVASLTERTIRPR